jgi:hypothetical protein
MSKLRHFSLFAIVAAATGLSMISIEQGWAGGALTGRELQRKMAGHTWAWKSEAFGSSGVATCYRDGRLVMTVDGQDDLKRGRWRIDGDRFCTTLAGGTESCFDGISQADEGTLFSERPRTTFTLRESN